MTKIYYRYSVSVFSCFVIWPERTVPLKRPPAGQELLVMCRRTALKNMVRKIIQPWWIRKQIALTVARLPSWGLRCCRPKEPLSEPRRGEFRRRAANRRANRTGNAACQEIVFESSWRYIFYKIISMAFIFTFTQTSATTFYLKVYVFFSNFWYFFES